jgi:hypothetical protein
LLVVGLVVLVGTLVVAVLVAMLKVLLVESLQLITP